MAQKLRRIKYNLKAKPKIGAEPLPNFLEKCKCVSLKLVSLGSICWEILCLEAAEASLEAVGPDGLALLRLKRTGAWAGLLVLPVPPGSLLGPLLRYPGVFLLFFSLLFRKDISANKWAFCKKCCGLLLPPLTSFCLRASWGTGTPLPRQKHPLWELGSHFTINFRLPYSRYDCITCLLPACW